MTDRELLELAAKAAGTELMPMEVKNVTEQGDDRFIGYMTNPEQWPRGWFNPLTDDGDALRLAVKLRLWVQVSERSVWIAQNADEILGEMAASTLVMFSEHCGDPYAATRRAIVRAAAEIGRSMK